MSVPNGSQPTVPKTLRERLGGVLTDTFEVIVHIFAGGLCSATIIIVHHGLQFIESWGPKSSKPFMAQAILWTEWVTLIASSLLFFAFLAVPIVAALERVYNVTRAFLGRVRSDLFKRKTTPHV